MNDLLDVVFESLTFRRILDCLGLIKDFSEGSVSDNNVIDGLSGFLPSVANLANLVVVDLN